MPQAQDTQSARSERVTMKDIASHLGVSVNTVHKALTGKSGVSERTRDKILAYAHEHGYRRNINASNLSRSTRSLVVCLPSTQGDGRYFYAYAWDGCRRYMYEMHNSGLRFESMEFELANYREHLQRLLARVHGGEAIDGVLAMAPTTAAEADALRELSAAGLAIVLLNGDDPSTDRFGAVVADYDTAGRLLAEQTCNLIRTASKSARVLLLSGDAKVDSHRRVTEAFRNYLQMHAPFVQVECVQGAHAQADALRAMLVARLGSQKPDVACSVFAAGSEVLCDALVEAGLAGELPALGSDLFPENELAMRRGILTNVVYKAPADLAYRAIGTLAEHVLWGADPEDVVQTGPVELVFRSNLSSYYRTAR